MREDKLIGRWLAERVGALFQRAAGAGARVDATGPARWPAQPA